MRLVWAFMIHIIVAHWLDALNIAGHAPATCYRCVKSFLAARIAIRRSNAAGQNSSALVFLSSLQSILELL